MSDTTVYSVTFIFPLAVVTTTVIGDDAVIPRAKALLVEELGIQTDKAQEVQVHEHP